MIYLDNAATTLHKPKEVQEAVIAAFGQMGNSGRGASEPALKALGTVYDAREALARLFHAENASEIVFTANSTEALNIAIKGILDPGDHVITTVLEHNSVLRPLYECRRKGVEMTILTCDEYANISYEEMEKAVRKNTRAIICTHASNMTGNMISLESVGKIAAKYGILFIVDASQTAGVWEIDVQKYGISVLCFTGHKGLMGPQGTGGLYVRKGVKINPLKVGGSGIHSFDHDHPKAMPERLEAGTLNVHGIAGLGGALNYLSEIGTEAIIKKERSLIKRLEDQIRDLQNIHLYGNPDSSQRVGILSFNMGDEDSAYVADWLFVEEEIAVRSGAHCAPLMHETLGTKMQGAVRISVSHKNTEEEIDRTANAIKKLSQLLE